MLGEQIGEGRGKRTARRVVCTEPNFKIEVSFEDMSKLLGFEGMTIGTYVSWPKPDGSLHGEGEGVWATMDGDQVTWKGTGVGRFTAGGGVSYRGLLSYTTRASKLARLNTVGGIFEFEIDSNGNTVSKIWEWK